MIWLSGTIMLMALVLVVLSVLARSRRQRDYLAIQEELTKRDEAIARIQANLSRVCSKEPVPERPLKFAAQSRDVREFRVARIGGQLARARERVAFDRNTVRWFSPESFNELSGAIRNYEVYLSDKGPDSYALDEPSAAVMTRSGRGKDLLEAPNPWWNVEVRTVH